MANSTQYLLKRGHSWYFKRAVPTDLQQCLGKKQIVEALGTRDLSEAQRLRWERMAHWERRFAELRGAQRPDETMSPREVFNDLLNYLRDIECPVPTNACNGSVSHDELTEFEVRQQLLLEQAISDHGVDGDGRPKAMSPHQQAQWDALQAYLAESKGKPAKEIEDYGLTLSEATDRYLARAAQGKDSQTVRQHKGTLKRLGEFLNDKPLSKLTRQDVGRFIGLLETFSSSWGKSPQDPERSLKELRMRYAGKGSPLSDNTLNRHLMAIRSLWRWAEANGEVNGRDPTDGLFRKTKPKASKEKTYKPFSPQEMRHLFSGKLPADHALVEVSLVALYSGMRLSEVLGLAWDDVGEESGVAYFDIKRAKSTAGVRRVPVHDALGWLLKRSHSSGSIWPSLVAEDLDGAADRVSKKFGYFKRSKGFSQADKTFHSFRKTFITTLARADVQEAEIAQIVGHEHTQITFSVYNPEGFPLTQCKRAVDRFRVDGLDPGEVVRRSLSRQGGSGR